jgi:hypothetical protein
MSAACLAEMQGLLKGRVADKVPDAPPGSIEITQLHGRHRTTGIPAFQVAVRSLKCTEYQEIWAPTIAIKRNPRLRLCKFFNVTALDRIFTGFKPRRYHFEARPD